MNQRTRIERLLMAAIFLIAVTEAACYILGQVGQDVSRVIQ